MSRLVEPISQEEFEKLPKWQQFFNEHWYLFPGIYTLIFVTIIMLAIYFN